MQRRFSAGRLSIGLLALGVIGAACDEAPRYPSGADDWTLYRSIAQAEVIEVATPSDDFSQQLEARWKSIDPNAAKRTRFRALGGNAGAGETRILVGTPADGVPSQLARLVGAEVVEGQGFRILGREFFEAGDALRAVMEDPRRPGMPLTLWFGNDLTQLISYLDDLHPRWRPRLDVFDRGDLAYSCPLTRAGLPDMDNGVDYQARRVAAAEHAGAAELPGLRLWANESPGAARLTAYVQAMVTARLTTLRALNEPVGKNKPGPRVEVYLSTQPAELSAIIGEPALSKVNPIRKSVDVLLGRDLPDDRGAAVARATALAVAGEPAHPWMLEGIGVAAAGSWWNHPLEELVGEIVGSGTAPSLEQLVDPASDAILSPHVLGPLRGHLMLFLLEDIKPKGLRSLWRGVREWEVNGRLKVLWGESLQKTVSSTAAARRLQVAERRRYSEEELLGGFRAGVALSDARVDGDSDYLSEQVLERLDEAKQLGARSFSVHVQVPLFTGPLKEDYVLPGVASASASDLALFAVLSRGKAYGLSPVLVIEPLAADSGPRADQAALVDVPSWESFFGALIPVVQHYGILAELAGVDVLCIGRELSIAMNTAAPDDAEAEEEVTASLRAVRAQGWSATVRIARGVFHGVLTTSTRAPGQAERFAQWPLFDAIAIELWPAFDDRDGVSPNLESATRSYAHMLRRYNSMAREIDKPLLVLQAGFPARAGSWSAPFRLRGEPDTAAQVKAYSALSAAVEAALEDSMPLAGLHLWTWPVGAGSGRGFAPASDEALEVARGLFALER